MEKLCKLADEQLVEIYAKGDNSAFDVLLSRYQQKLYSYILFLVHNEDTANDLFQETFVKAIVTIQQGRYVESGKFSAWLTRIAHNLIIDKYRQDKNANLISNDNDECDIFNNAALSDITVEMKIIKEQSLADVERLVKELPAVQQEVVYMRFYQLCIKKVFSHYNKTTVWYVVKVTVYTNQILVAYDAIFTKGTFPPGKYIGIY